MVVSRLLPVGLVIAVIAAVAGAAPGCTLPTKTRVLPERIPVPVDQKVAPRGVRFDVVPHLAPSSPKDWELQLDVDAGVDTVVGREPADVISARQNTGLRVPFGQHVVRATVTAFELRAQNTMQMVSVPVTVSVPCATGTCMQSTTQMQSRPVTTMVRTAVGTCQATVDVEVSYVEARRLEVDVATTGCAARELPVSPF
jgi:hypothetical protein